MGKDFKERREIEDFFKDRGERCVKVAPLSGRSNTMDYVCQVILTSGKREKVIIRIQKNPSSKESYQKESVCPNCLV